MIQQGSIGTCARRAALAGVGLGLAAALASGCAEDEPVPDSATLGELSPAQMQSLCDELRNRQQPAGYVPPNIIGSGSSANRTNLAPACYLEYIACDVTAGEARACEQALSDVGYGGQEWIAACAPLRQRGCAAAGSAAWADACPDLAADVAPFEGIYELSRHTVNDTSCDAEGASVLEADAQRLLVVVTIMLSGAPIGRMDRCDDLEHCRGVADSLRLYSERTDPVTTSDYAESRPRQLVCHPTIDGALQSQYTSVSFIPEDGRCNLEQTEEIITRAQDGTLRLESRTHAWEPDEDGSCPVISSFDGPVPPEVGCSRLRVYEARLISAL